MFFVTDLFKALTNDEPKPRSPSKFAGYERLKVGHKKIWLRRWVAARRRYLRCKYGIALEAL